jgi:hypothetical protein
VTEDGYAVCTPSASGESCSCSSQIQIVQEKDLSIAYRETSLWRKIRSGVMFGIACVASPCCTLLIVPLGLSLLAGTPIAVWLSANLGWVYGGFTLLSIISLVLGFRWMGQKSNSRHSVDARSKTGIQPIQEVTHL